MIEIKCSTKDTLNLSEITEFQGNLKERDSTDYEKIERSIRKHGFSFPFFIWRHDGVNHCLDGHGRLGTLQRMVAGGEQIPPLPVVYVNCKNEADAKEMLLKLNSTYGRMTADSVREFIKDLDIDFEDLALPEGILDFSIDDVMKDTTGDDDAPEVEIEEAVSKPGEIYELGAHRLMCGDSTSADDMARLMGESKADLIVTDPPYNVDYGNKNKFLNRMCPGKGGKHEKEIKNDRKSKEIFFYFLKSAFTNMLAALKQGGVFYIWLADWYRLTFESALTASGGLMKQTILWVKNNFVLGRQDYQWRHEPCLYGWKEGAGHYWEGRRDLSTVFDETRGDWKKMSKEQLIAELKRFDNEVKTSIIYEDKPARSEAHPTMKPVRLFERLIMNSSKAEDIVLDPFGGSGTTIIAAAKTNRIARVMELDPHYCDVIRKRWTAWAKENGKEVGSGGLE